MFNLEKHRREFHEQLHTTIDGVLSPNFCADICRKVIESPGQANYIDHEEEETDDLGAAGARHFFNFHGPTLRHMLPGLWWLYVAMHPLMRLIARDDLFMELEDHHDSVTIKMYPKGPGQLGAHIDSCGLTCLLYLTDNREGALRIHSSPPVDILPQAGRMVLMQGSAILHESLPTPNEIKIVVQFTYHWNG